MLVKGGFDQTVCEFSVDAWWITVAGESHSKFHNNLSGMNRDVIGTFGTRAFYMS